MTTPSGTCGWCQHTRPEHSDDCPVTQTARGLREMFSGPKETAPPFHMTVDLPGYDDAADLAELHRVEDEEMERAGVTWAPIEDPEPEDQA